MGAGTQIDIVGHMQMSIFPDEIAHIRGRTIRHLGVWFRTAVIGGYGRSVSGGLTIPFEVRNGSGEVTVTLDVLTDPTTFGEVSDAAEFPICRASVDFSLDGYAGLLGWVQLVGTKTDSQSERAFEIDPLEVFYGLEMPFAFYGLNPSLFDAPYRSDPTVPG